MTELAAPKKIVGGMDLPVEVDVAISAPVEIPKPRIKREITIREADNGYILSVWAGTFKEEWVFNRLSKAIRAIVAFLNTTEE